jgi:hypothetical protein
MSHVRKDKIWFVAGPFEVTVVVGKKLRRGIAADDVVDIFNDQCIRELASIAKLPAGTDLRRLGLSIREAARIYATEARIPTVNELHAEIATLYSAASRRRYEQVGALIEKLSPTARVLLKERGARPTLGVELPSPDALRDTARRERACTMIATLCQFGGGYSEGRQRPSGKRSRTWRPLLNAPGARRHFRRRDVERNFVMWLSVTWLEATGKPPARTARHSTLGPFARFVDKCLRLVGAHDADTVELINELNRRRCEMGRTRRFTIGGREVVGT